MLQTRVRCHFWVCVPNIGLDSKVLMVKAAGDRSRWCLAPSHANFVARRPYKRDVRCFADDLRYHCLAAILLGPEPGRDVGSVVDRGEQEHHVVAMVDGDDIDEVRSKFRFACVGPACGQGWRARRRKPPEQRLGAGSHSDRLN
jgi:hypothetical protein